MSAQPLFGPTATQDSLVFANRKGLVYEKRGPLSDWAQVGEVVTASTAALAGREGEFSALIENPETTLVLTDSSFGRPGGNTVYTIEVRWEPENDRFTIRTAAAELALGRSEDTAQAEHHQRCEAAQLELEREHFRNIYEQSPQLAICLDRSGAIVAASQQLRRQFLEIADTSGSDYLINVLTSHRVWTSLWQGSEPVGIPIRAQDVTGRRAELEMSAIAAIHPNQLHEEAYFTLVDVTERNASRIALMERSDDLETLSKRLQDSNKKLDQFASVAAHDLLAPLRRISAFTQMLEDDLGDNCRGPVSIALEAIQSSASTGQALVEDILQLSSISSMDARRERFRIFSLFQEVAREYDYRLKEIGAEVELIGRDYEVEGDIRLAKLIMRNLLSNSISYRKADRALQLQLKLTSTGTPHVRIELIDNGIGMEPEVAQQAFKPFVRLTDKVDFQGHGLGLAMVDEAAKTMGWHVFAHSEPDLGTRIVLTAPLDNINPRVQCIDEASVGGLRERLKRIMQRISDATGETVDLAILRRNKMLFIEQVAGCQRLRAVSSIGEMFPLTTTANGKAALSCLPRERATALIADELGEDETAVNSLLEQLNEIDKGALGIDENEHTEGVSALGFALDDKRGCIYALSVPVPNARFSQKKEMLTTTLKKFRDNISSEISM